jgi:hypothetical protein
MSGRGKDEDVNRLSEDETRIERMLAAMPLPQSRLNRDKTMFLAGRATESAARKKQRPEFGSWFVLGGMTVTAAAGLLAGVLLSSRPDGSNRRLVPPVSEQPRDKSIGPGEPLVAKRTGAPEENLRHERSSLLDARERMLEGAEQGQSLALVDFSKSAPSPEAEAHQSSTPAATYRDLMGIGLDRADHE